MTSAIIIKSNRVTCLQNIEQFFKIKTSRRIWKIDVKDDYKIPGKKWKICYIKKLFHIYSEMLSCIPYNLDIEVFVKSLYQWR